MGAIQIFRVAMFLNDHRLPTHEERYPIAVRPRCLVDDKSLQYIAFTIGSAGYYPFFLAYSFADWLSPFPPYPWAPLY